MMDCEAHAGEKSKRRFGELNNCQRIKWLNEDREDV